MKAELERILPRVQKPARYTGGEYNEVIKDKAEVDVRFAMCFPDTYEIGMSNLGMRILYGVMNEAERRQLIEALISEIQIYPERQPNGQWLKSIKFKLPIIEEDMSISLDNKEQAECVALMTRTEQ